MILRIRQHWREYLSEAAALGGFMISATAFATLFQHPLSPLSAWIRQTETGPIFMGLAMGLTAVGLIYSPFGRRSGAHMNPAVTVTYLRLGKICRADAVAYVIAQCVGGLGGTALAVVALAGLPADPSVNFIVTRPGSAGPVVAFVAEAAISFGMMLTILGLSNHRRTAPLTGIAAGSLVALYIMFEAPVSGMSMNPARSLGPALLAGSFDSFWIYCLAPPLGMLSAAELFVGVRGLASIRCAKLHHPAGPLCIFHCQHSTALSETRI